MKKLIIFIFTALVLNVLCSCSTNDIKDTRNMNKFVVIQAKQVTEEYTRRSVLSDGHSTRIRFIPVNVTTIQYKVKQINSPTKFWFTSNETYRVGDTLILTR
jgi:hypothetical protein